MPKKALTRRQQSVLALLKRRPDCVESTEVAQALDLTRGHTADVLRQLRDLGRAACSSRGRWARWGLPHHVRALQALQVAAAAQQAQVRAGAKAQADREAVEAFSKRPLSHATVPAATSPRPITTAPASVFHLATSADESTTAA